MQRNEKHILMDGSKPTGGLKTTLNLSGHDDVVCCPKLVVAKSSVLVKNKNSWVPSLEIWSRWIWDGAQAPSLTRMLRNSVSSKFGKSVFKYLLLNNPTRSEGIHYFVLYKKFLIKIN